METLQSALDKYTQTMKDKQLDNTLLAMPKRVNYIDAEQITSEKWKMAKAKVVCYYRNYKDGTPRPKELQDIPVSHPLYDHKILKGRKVKNQQEMIQKGLRHIEKHKNNIISALIFLRNHHKQMEYRITEWTSDLDLHYHLEPEYRTDDLGNVLISKFTYYGKPDPFLIKKPNA